MFSPVGSQPPSVYWRRRILVLGSVVVLVLLLLLTVRVVTGGGDDTPLSDGSVGASTSATSSAGSTSAPASSSSGTSQSRTSATKRSSAQATSSTVMPVACTKANLAVQAVPGETKYKVGQQPTVSMQVTNTGAKPCTQDLADKQVVLKVYNGESRVWGSHDCEVQPGTAVRTLPTNQPVKVTVTWSGRTSQDGCKGTRQRVGAGTYTLYATLSGKSGKAARFTIG